MGEEVCWKREGAGLSESRGRLVAEPGLGAGSGRSPREASSNRMSLERRRPVSLQARRHLEAKKKGRTITFRLHATYVIY